MAAQCAPEFRSLIIAIPSLPKWMLQLDGLIMECFSRLSEGQIHDAV
jgi:hypothetical protein